MATESTFKNMTLTLFTITAVAAIVLGFVNKITQEPIKQTKEKKLTEALAAVLPKFDKTTIQMVKPDDGDDSLTIYSATKEGVFVGYAVKTYTMKGFSGYIEVLAGFEPTGTIFNTVVLQHKETPGLGDKLEIKKSQFSAQFKGKDPNIFVLKVKKDGGPIDAISAATISSRAYCDALQRAFNTIKSLENPKPDSIQTQIKGGTK